MARGFDIEASNQGQLNGGVVVGPRSKYNFVEGGGGISIAVSDNPANDSVDVTLDTSAVGGGVLGAANAGGTAGPQPTVRLIAGANITITLFEDLPGSELEFTIATSASFPGFGAGLPIADSGVGGAGVAATASRSDHVHPVSSAYGLKAATGFVFGGNPLFIPTGFTPVVGLYAGYINSSGNAFTAGYSVGIGVQVSVGNSNNANGSNVLFDQGQGTFFRVTQFDATQVVVSRVSGVGNLIAVGCVLG